MTVRRPPLWQLAASWATARKPPFSLRRATPASCDVGEHTTPCPACGGSLGYVRPHGQAGGDATVVLLHGSPGSWRAWAPYLADRALRARFSLVAFDRPGYGASGSCRCHRNIATQGASIAAALDRVARDAPLIVVGHSFGGPVALEVAGRQQRRTKGCLLLAPSLDPAQERTLWFQRLAATPGLRTVLPRAIRSCNEEIMMLRGGLEEQANRLPSLAVPVHCLHGALDDLVPVENAAYLGRTATRAPLDIEILPGACHDIPWSHGHAVVDRIHRLASH